MKLLDAEELRGLSNWMSHLNECMMRRAAVGETYLVIHAAETLYKAIMHDQLLLMDKGYKLEFLSPEEAGVRCVKVSWE